MKRFLFLSIALFSLFNINSQTIPYVIVNNGAGNQNIRDGSCSLLTSIPQYGKAVASLQTTNCSYSVYSVSIPSVLQSGPLSGYACYGAPGTCDMTPDAGTAYVEVYNVNPSGLFIRTSAGTGNVTISGQNAKAWDGQRFARTGNTGSYGGFTWYEIYLTNNCNQTTGWVTGQYLTLYNGQTTQYTISTTSSPSLGGSTSGGGTFNSGATCNLTASANAGYTFVNWTENGNQVSASTSYSFTVNSNRTLTANFSQNPIQYTISTTSSPSLGGSTTGGGTFNSGATCNLTASANAGYTFLNWTENGNQVSASTSYSFTVNSNRTLTANFSQNPIQYTISTSSSPSIGGSTTGGGTFNSGATCNLTASANTGYTFVNWTENGNQVSASTSYSFTVNSNRTLTANFSQNPIQYTISTTANPGPGGSTSGGGTFNSGTTCYLTATANSGYTFINWTENGNQVSANASYNFTVNSNRTLIANFNQINNTYLTINNPNGGEVFTSGTVNTINGTCSSNITTIQLQYTTNNGGNFYPIISITPSNNVFYYSWTVPFTPSTQCKIQATGIYSSGQVTDLSDNLFIISPTCFTYTADCNYCYSDYPYTDAPNSPCITNNNNTCSADCWGFCRYNCTSWAAWCVNKAMGNTTTNGPFLFSNSSVLGHATTLGNAIYWKDVLTNLSGVGITADQTPATGAIAWWGDHSGDPDGGGGIGVQGHVAFVPCVSGNTVTISEFNFAPACYYNLRTVDASLPFQTGNRKPDYYIHINGLGSATDILSLVEEEKFKIYPNPNDGKFTLQLFNDYFPAGCMLSIFNSIGEKVFESNYLNDSQNMIDLAGISPGLYFVQIKDNNGIVSKRIIIQ